MSDSDLLAPDTDFDCGSKVLNDTIRRDRYYD